MVVLISVLIYYYRQKVEDRIPVAVAVGAATSVRNK